MKRSILKGMALFLLLCSGGTLACAQQQKQDTIVVSRDGTGKYRDIQEAVEAVRAFMDYTVTIFIKNGIYKEKLVIPSWVKSVQMVGEDAEKTIITYDDHANINKMGTFRTYTVKVEGSDITFKNLTIENNAAPLGQAVALHTEGDRLMFVGCRFLGNQEVDLYYSVDGVLIKSIADTDAHENEHLPTTQLPAAMKTFIDGKYAGARIMEVDVEDDKNDWDFGFTEVDIIHFDSGLNRNVSKEVLFDKGGEWYSTSWEVRRNELPAAVTNIISVEYAEYQMDDAEYFEMATGTSYYQIELEGNNSPDIDIKVTTDGTILK